MSGCCHMYLTNLKILYDVLTLYFLPVPLFFFLRFLQAPLISLLKTHAIVLTSPFLDKSPLNFHWNVLFNIISSSWQQW